MKSIYTFPRAYTYRMYKNVVHLTHLVHLA